MRYDRQDVVETVTHKDAHYNRDLEEIFSKMQLDISRTLYITVVGFFFFYKFTANKIL